MGLEFGFLFVVFFIYLVLGIKKIITEIEENSIRVQLFRERLKETKTINEVVGIDKYETWTFGEDTEETEDSPLHIDTMTGLNPSTPFWDFDAI